MYDFGWCKTIDCIYGRFLVVKLPDSEIFISFKYNGIGEDIIVNEFKDDTERDKYYEDIDESYCESLFHTQTPSIN